MSKYSIVNINTYNYIATYTEYGIFFIKIQLFNYVSFRRHTRDEETNAVAEEPQPHHRKNHRKEITGKNHRKITGK